MLQFSEEAFIRAKDTYHDQAQAMKNLKLKLNAAVDDIKDGWNTSAGDEFLKKFDDQWMRNISEYIDVIQQMSENMDIAGNKYQTVYDYAEMIKLH